MIQPYFIDPLTRQEFTREEMINYTKSLLANHDLGPPFTIQRFAELLLNPNSQYPRNQESKYLLALSRVLNVASSTTDFENINVVLLSEQREREIADQQQRKNENDDDSDSDEDLLFPLLARSPVQSNESENNETDNKENGDKNNEKSDKASTPSGSSVNTPQPSGVRSRSNSFNVRAGVYPPGTPSASVNLFDQLDSVVIMSPIPWLNEKKPEETKDTEANLDANTTNDLTEQSDSNSEEKEKESVADDKDKDKDKNAPQSDDIEMDEIGDSSEPVKQETAEQKPTPSENLQEEKKEELEPKDKDSTEESKPSLQESGTKTTDEQSKESASVTGEPTDSKSTNSTLSPLKRSVDQNEPLNESLHPAKKQHPPTNDKDDNKEKAKEQNKDKEEADVTKTVDIKNSSEATPETNTVADECESSKAPDAKINDNENESEDNTTAKAVDDKRVEVVGKDGEKRRRLDDESDQ